jgi:hypothetical protein
MDADRPIKSRAGGSWGHPVERIFMRINTLIFFWIILSASGPVFGGTYQWTDDNGTLYFSDDISSVPEKHRKTVKDINATSSQASSENGRTFGKFRPGRYEISSASDGPNQQSHSTTQCITEINDDWINKNPGCRLISKDVQGNIYTWVVKCDGNPESEITSRFALYEESISGTMSVKTLNNNEQTTSTIQGKRIGDCTGKEGRTATSPVNKYKRGSAEFSALENELISSWDRMRNELKQKRIGAALIYFTEKSRQSFRTRFKSIENQLPKVAIEMDGLKLINVSNNVLAECDFRSTVNGSILSHMVQFVLDSDGEWRIKTF